MNELGDGLIECDVWLDPDALINILFRADVKNHRYYGARLETREKTPASKYYDKFLRRDGPEGWWVEAQSLFTKTYPWAWYHMAVLFVGDQMELYKNGELVASWTDSKYESGQVGIMGEQGMVHIDNFRIRQVPANLDKARRIVIESK